MVEENTEVDVVALRAAQRQQQLDAELTGVGVAKETTEPTEEAATEVVEQAADESAETEAGEPAEDGTEESTED